MPDRTQNVLIPLPCPFCGAQPRMKDSADNVVLRPIAEIVCTGAHDTIMAHSAAAYGATLQEALANWNERAAPPPAPNASGDVENFRKAWNDNRGPLPQATKLTGERLDKLRRRIKEGLTLEEFTRAAWTCSHTEFLLRGTPKQEFRATFDWLVSNSGIVAKVLDGTYGPTGKTEEELRAEKQQEEQRAANAESDLYREMAERMKRGICPVRNFQPAVFGWEITKSGKAEVEVYNAWASYVANGMNIVEPVRTWIDQWMTQGKTQSQISNEALQKYRERHDAKI